MISRIGQTCLVQHGAYAKAPFRSSLSMFPSSTAELASHRGIVGLGVIE